jgi:hypothetical protein
MSDLRDLTNEQLTDRNLHLGGQIDTIRNARLEIKRELDRRAELERAAQAIAGLPDEHRARALAAADPELAERVVQLAADLPAAPAQTSSRTASSPRSSSVSRAAAAGAELHREGVTDERWISRSTRTPSISVSVRWHGSLRSTFEQIAVVKAWLDSQTDAQLTALGYSAAEITLLRASYTDLNNLGKIAHAQATQPAANDFFFNAGKLLGVQ